MQTTTATEYSDTDVNALLLRLRNQLQTHRQHAAGEQLAHELEWLDAWLRQLPDDYSHAPEIIDQRALSMLVSIDNNLSQATLEEARQHGATAAANTTVEAEKMRPRG